MGCHRLLQETFPTQGWNPGLLHYGQTLYRLSRRRSSSVFSAAVRNGHRVRGTWPLAGRAALAAAPASICQGSMCTRVPQPLSCRLREFPSSSLLKSCPASGGLAMELSLKEVVVILYFLCSAPFASHFVEIWPRFCREALNQS